MKNCLSRMSRKLSCTVLRRWKGSNPFSLVDYACGDFREATEKMINGYSKKAYPWDNACIESFHALIKREWLNQYKIFNYNHAYKLIFDYIEAFHNTVSIHSHCGYLSPVEYEKEHEHKLNKIKKRTG